MKLAFVSIFGGLGLVSAYTSIPGTTCGVTDLTTVYGERKTPISFNRVVGGEDATLGQYPWQSRFIACSSEGSQCYMCGATLVSDYWLITAAHCVDGDLPDVGLSVPAFSYVNLGTLAPSSGDQGDKYFLSHITIHDQWSGSGVVGYDIAALKTQAQITLNHDVYPACLPKQTECFRATSEVWISGYGAESYQGSNAATLQGVMLDIRTHSDCTGVYGALAAATLCAGGGQAGGLDSCQGDSGGPMAALSEDAWYLYGIVSFGYQCAVPGIPGVYTRVTSYVDWIVQTSIDNGEAITATYALDGTPSCDDADDAMWDKTTSDAFSLADLPENQVTTAEPVVTTVLTEMDVIITSTAELVSLYYETQAEGVNATTTILQHGCYCSALNGMNSLTGISDSTVSSLDSICQYNRKCKNCGHRDAFTDSGLYCDGVDAPMDYTVTVDGTTVTCDQSNNDCQFAHCECDLKIARDLYSAQMMDDSMVATTCPISAVQQEADAGFTFAPPTTAGDVGEGVAVTGPPATGEPVITENSGMADECCGMLPFYIQYNSFVYPSYTCENEVDTGMPYVADDGTAVHTFMWPEVV